MGGAIGARNRTKCRGNGAVLVTGRERVDTGDRLGERADARARSPLSPRWFMSRQEFIRTWAVGAAPRAFDELIESDFDASDIPAMVDRALASDLPWARIDGMVGNMAQAKLGEFLVFCPHDRRGTDVASLTAPGEDTVSRVAANGEAVEAFKQTWRDALSYARTWLTASEILHIENAWVPLSDYEERRFAYLAGQWFDPSCINEGIL
jgi:hypothetical protein